MRKTLGQSLKAFFTEPRWEKVRNIFWFVVITVVFHILWRIWAVSFHFAPVGEFLSSTRAFIAHQLFNHATFILRDVLNVTISTETKIIITKNGLRLLLGESSAGLKQMCQFVLLILLFSGSWKNRLWYIPVGIIILHLTNIFRIICLVVIAMHWPRQIQYAHDNWLRILYYVVIFALWVIWVERFSSRKPGRAEK
jgi:exosortase/archaeosortase family protein